MKLRDRILLHYYYIILLYFWTTLYVHVLYIHNLAENDRAGETLSIILNEIFRNRA